MGDFVEKASWEEFRRREFQVLERFMAPGACAGGAVIATGGGVVETPNAVALLKAHSGVVFIDRHEDDLMAYLSSPEGTTTTRPKLPGDIPLSIYRRRLPIYLDCASKVFTVPRGETDLKHVNSEFERFAAFISRQSSPDVCKEGTFMLSLTFPDFADVDQDLLKRVAEGATVLEFRMDLLKSRGPHFVREQLALLRKAVPGLPIVFTLRSKKEGGAFEGSDAEYVAGVSVGIAAGCEFIDIEASRGEAAKSALFAAKGASKVVCSHHEFHRMPSEDELKQMFSSVADNPAVDVAKLVVMAKRFDDSFTIQRLAKETLPAGKPFIAMCLGEVGSFSRVLNRTLTPVTHPDMPAKAAPGQLSIQDIQLARHALA